MNQSTSIFESPRGDYYTKDVGTWAKEQDSVCNLGTAGKSMRTPLRRPQRTHAAHYHAIDLFRAAPDGCPAAADNEIAQSVSAAECPNRYSAFSTHSDKPVGLETFIKLARSVKTAFS